jgi:hypothetical protein
MKYTGTNNAQQSNSNHTIHSSFLTQQSSVIKRLMVLTMMTLFLVFAGFQSTPVTQASASDGCDLVCGEPFIDANDGRCYQMCCPADEQCKRACELRPCFKQ